MQGNSLLHAAHSMNHCRTWSEEIQVKSQPNSMGTDAHAHARPWTAMPSNGFKSRQVTRQACQGLGCDIHVSWVIGMVTPQFDTGSGFDLGHHGRGQLKTHEMH